MSKNYTKADVSRLPGQMVEIVGEIGVESMNAYRTEAIKNLKAGLEIDGFRKGAVPDAMVVSKVGEMNVLEEAAQLALNAAYPEILENEKLDAIGRPEITITKIAPGVALEFKISTALAPEVKLADYKKIAQTYQSAPQTSGKPGEKTETELGTKLEKEVGTDAVSEKEIDDVVLNLRKDVAHAQFHQEHDGKESSSDHSHGEFAEEDLPEVNEEFLKTLAGSSGMVFASSEDLRVKIRESLTREKEAKVKDKRRTEILEEIITQSSIDLPDIIVQAEIDKMIAQFKDDVTRAGATYEGYLEHIKKTEDDIKKEWRETAEKRAKSLIVLSRIAEAEKLAPAEEDIKREMDKILSQDNSLERFRVRMFVDNFLSNEMVFAFLESQKY